MTHVPNMISTLRVIGALIFVACVVKPQPSYGIALGVFTIAALSDFFDGYVARRFGVSAPFGVFLDPFADKTLVLSVFGAFWMRGIIPGWIFVVTAARDLIVTILRMQGGVHSVSVPTLYIGKIKTTLQFIVIYLILLVLIMNGGLMPHGGALAGVVMGTLYAMVAVTVYSGVVYVVRWYRQR